MHILRERFLIVQHCIASLTLTRGSKFVTIIEEVMILEATIAFLDWLLIPTNKPSFCRNCMRSSKVILKLLLETIEFSSKCTLFYHTACIDDRLMYDRRLVKTVATTVVCFQTTAKSVFWSCITTWHHENWLKTTIISVIWHKIPQNGWEMDYTSGPCC